MLEDLLKKHTELQNKADSIVKQYYNENITNSFFATEEEKKNAKKNLKKLDKEYQNIRDQIYDIEDKISKIDESILDNIVEPLNEDIEEQVWIVCG